MAAFRAALCYYCTAHVLSIRKIHVFSENISSRNQRQILWKGTVHHIPGSLFLFGFQFFDDFVIFFQLMFILMDHPWRATVVLKCGFPWHTMVHIFWQYRSYIMTLYRCSHYNSFCRSEAVVAGSPSRHASSNRASRSLVYGKWWKLYGVVVRW